LQLDRSSLPLTSIVLAFSSGVIVFYSAFFPASDFDSKPFSIPCPLFLGIAIDDFLLQFTQGQRLTDMFPLFVCLKGVVQGLDCTCQDFGF
jgi:hypothetical protein